MLVPGFTSILVGLFLLNRLRDVPQFFRFTAIVLYRGEIEETRQYNKEAAEASLTAKQILFERVLNNKFVWIMAVSYFFVYVVRTAINDWTIPYLVELGFDRVLASASVMWFEIGRFHWRANCWLVFGYVFPGQTGTVYAGMCDRHGGNFVLLCGFTGKFYAIGVNIATA